MASARAAATLAQLFAYHSGLDGAAAEAETARLAAELAGVRGGWKGAARTLRDLVRWGAGGITLGLVQPPTRVY